MGRRRMNNCKSAPAFECPSGFNYCVFLPPLLYGHIELTGAECLSFLLYFKRFALFYLRPHIPEITEGKLYCAVNLEQKNQRNIKRLIQIKF